MNQRYLIALIVFFLLSSRTLKAQNDFYDIQSIQKIEVYFSQPDWDYQMDTAKHGADGYIIADWVKINEIQFNQVGVKYKGNSSYDSTYLKNPIHIELDHVIAQTYNGISDIKLSNGYADPSVIREVLAYDILKNYMDCPRSNFANLYINGNYIGLYSNDESIDKKFVSKYFNSSSRPFFKCNPIVSPGPTTKSNLRYIPGGDSTAYFNFYELKSDEGWEDLIRLCDTVTNYPDQLPASMDLDRVLWMLAFNSVLINLDSYTGVFCQNYYIYKDKTDRFNPVVWDLNMAFGGFPFVGSGGTSMGSLTIANMQQLNPFFHDNDPFWPLIKAVMSNPSWKKQYVAHARTINEENFVNNNYLSTASFLQSLVDSSVQADPNAFFTYTQFQNGLYTDYQFGSYMVPGIANLMDARSNYLLTVPEFVAIPPAIINVNVSHPSPQLSDTIFITTRVINADSVYLGYRNSTYGKFERVIMFDDGLHGDLAAGDNIFGAAVIINSLTTEYYIYAENNSAAMFSPERAEHEFYSIQTDWTYPAPGSVVINEFLAVNTQGQQNEYGQYADWIELYNRTSSEISLYGLYLTDDFTRRAKFAFPQDAAIPANGYYIIWADEENSTPQYLHSNFKLNAGGEQLMLSDGFTVVMDSISYGQQIDDVSTGRCPNGTGNFQLIGVPSFNGENCKEDSTVTTGWANVKLYPNPASNEFNIFINDDPALEEIRVVNMIGQVVRRINPVTGKTVDIYGLNSGIYTIELISYSGGVEKRLKLVKSNSQKN
jgi:hypothetical protein